MARIRQTATGRLIAGHRAGITSLRRTLRLFSLTRSLSSFTLLFSVLSSLSDAPGEKIKIFKFEISKRGKDAGDNLRSVSYPVSGPNWSKKEQSLPL